MARRGAAGRRAARRAAARGGSGAADARRARRVRLRTRHADDAVGAANVLRIRTSRARARPERVCDRRLERGELADVLERHGRAVRGAARALLRRPASRRSDGARLDGVGARARGLPARRRRRVSRERAHAPARRRVRAQPVSRARRRSRRARVHPTGLRRRGRLRAARPRPARGLRRLRRTSGTSRTASSPLCRRAWRSTTTAGRTCATVDAARSRRSDSAQRSGSPRASRTCGRSSTSSSSTRRGSQAGSRVSCWRGVHRKPAAAAFAAARGRQPPVARPAHRVRPMCGICGIASRSGAADVDRLAAMSATLVHRGPDSGGEHVDGPVGARRAAALDHRPRRRRPADLERGRVVHRRPERRDLQLPRAAARARARRATSSARTATRRCICISTSSTAPSTRGACAACSRSRSGTRSGGGSCSRATATASSRSTTATPAARSSSRRSSARCRAARSISTRSRRFSRSTRSRRRTRSSATSASCLPGTCSSGRSTAALTLDRYARPGPVPADELRGDDEAELVEELRARLRDSVRAHLLADVPVGVLLSGGVDSARARRARRAGDAGSRAHVHDRLRGAQLRRAGRCAARRRALRDEPSRAARAARSAAAAAGARRGVRRAVRRLLGAADVPRLAARGRAREGRALRRGRRRALRRLLHVRRRSARRPRSRHSRGSRARSSSACRRSSAKASFDYKAKRFVRAAHLPPLERHHGWKEIFSPDLRAELTRRSQHVRPGRRLPRALRGDRGSRPARRGSRTSTSGSTSSTTCS